ncbi:methyltransferase domain-containing protein [Carnimonas bestiolae]|uniref:methyltransferase domain-containing protein n=1 Tax=Carnimonas bestiolae TaxID=3402172 RepID=UPI003F4A8B22
MAVECLGVAGDRYFTGAMAAKFGRSLYGASRGRLRLALVQHALALDIPFDAEPLLDAGGGLGQMSAWAAERGHRVTLIEPAAEMLEFARERLQGLDVTLVQGDVQSLASLAPGPWPRIICHAVLEWMAQPREGFDTLANQLAPGGWLSLMVFNRDALLLSNVVKGNFDKALNNDLAGKGRGTRLTPISPLTHQQIAQWCAEAGLEIRGITGIRVFHDYLREKFPSEAQLAQLRELEFAHCRVDPFWRMGRYLHYSLYRPL